MKLRKYQRRAVRWLERAKSGALVLPMRTGKTAVALTHVHNERLIPTLVVCPLSVVDVWVDEAEKWFPGMTVRTLVGIRGDRIREFDKQADVWVINYEGMRILLHLLKRKRWKCIILDESTRVKNPRALLTKAVMDLADHCIDASKLLLSGTIVTGSYLDLWSQMYFIDNGVMLGTSFWRFRDEFFVLDSFGVTWTVSWRKKHQLKGIFQSMSFIVPEIVIRLPKKVYLKRFCHLPREVKSAYNKLRDLFSTELQELDGRGRPMLLDTIWVLKKINWLRQIASGFVYSEEGPAQTVHNEKVSLLDEVCQEIWETEGSRKINIVVWCVYKEDVRRIRDWCKKQKLPFWSITGSTKPQERSRQYKEFNQAFDGTGGVFCGQIQTARFGIPLNARWVIYFTSDYSRENRTQSEERSRTPGLYSTVTYIDLLSRHTIEGDILSALKKKQKIVNFIRERGRF